MLTSFSTTSATSKHVKQGLYKTPYSLNIIVVTGVGLLRQVALSPFRYTKNQRMYFQPLSIFFLCLLTGLESSSFVPIRRPFVLLWASSPFPPCLYSPWCCRYCCRHRRYSVGWWLVVTNINNHHAEKGFQGVPFSALTISLPWSPRIEMYRDS